MLALAAALWLAAQPEPPPPPCREVRGRMFVANGAPAVRIGVVGKSRILGVIQPNLSFEDLPAEVREAWRGRSETHDLYGDYTVCPLKPDRPGVMQMVRLTAARNLVQRPAR